MYLFVADRLPGGFVDLQGSNDASLVVGMQFGGRQRIDLPQTLVQCLNANFLQLVLDSLPKLPIGWRARYDAPQ